MAAGSGSDASEPDRRGLPASTAVTWLLEGPRHVVLAVSAARGGEYLGRAVVGRPLDELFPELREQHLLTELDEVFASGTTATVDERALLVDADESGRFAEGFVNFTVSRWSRSDGGPGGLVVTMVDVTDRILARRFGIVNAEDFRTSDRASDDRRLGAGQAVAARTIQQAMLPSVLPSIPGMRIAARYLSGPDDAAGGDWYEVLALPDGRLCAAVGDVVGHGVPAAVVMGQLRTALGVLVAEETDPGALLDRLAGFAALLPGAEAATACVMIVDPVAGALCYASAGHPPPLMLTEDGSAHYLIGSIGTPLAASAARHRTAEHEFTQGATVVMYTDGVVARRGQPMEVGQLRLAARAVERFGHDPEVLCDHLAAELFELSAAEDDAVLLVIDRAGPTIEPLHLVVPARPGQLPLMRRAVQSWMRTAGVPEDDVLSVIMAFGEAAANAVEHAYGGLDGPDADVVVTAALAPNGLLSVSIRDRGRWRPPSPAPGSRGRGMFLMRESVDSVEVERGDRGTTVVLRRTVRKPARPSQESAGPDATDPWRADLGEDGPGPRGHNGGAGPGVQVVSRLAGGRVVAGVRGEIDDSNVAALWSKLLEAHRGGALPLTVDLSGVGYLASAGVRVIFELATVAREAGQRLRLVVPRAAVIRRILELCAVEQVADVVTAENTADT